MAGVGGEVVGVSVWEVMEARGAALTEAETWALLAAAATTIQDTALSGRERVEVATPESVVLQRCGRVHLLPTPTHSSAHPHCNYLPPEALVGHQIPEAERMLVFSLGRTLWVAAEHGTSGIYGTSTVNGMVESATTPHHHHHASTNNLSSSLRSTLSAMTHNLPAHGLTLVDIFQLLVERLNSRDRINYTAIVRSLYEEVLGPPLPPPRPPDPVMARQRSYSALDTRTSTSRRPSSLSLSQRSASVEELNQHPHHSLGSVKPAWISQTQPTDIYPTTWDQDFNHLSSMQDINQLTPSFRTSTRLVDTPVMEAQEGGAPGTQKKVPPKKPPRSRAMSVDNLLNSATELRRNLYEVVPKKRRLVMRTPSRLYHFTDSHLSTVVGCANTKLPPILGPEFVVRNKEPTKALTLLQDAQRGVVKKVTVILVTGRRLEVTCDPATTRVSHILQAVFQEENLPLKQVLGLAVLGSGEFHFVAPQTKLHKVSPPGWKERHPTKDGLIQDNFTLHLRFIYYLKFNNAEEMECSSRQLLYLQLRHDLLEGRFPLPSDDLLHVAALALQAEFGHKKEKDMGYFLAEHYVPESLLRGGRTVEVSQKLQQYHAALADLYYSEAQARFITTLQDTPYYGTHLYHVTQDKVRQQCWLGIRREGVLVSSSGALTCETITGATLHPWQSVKRMSYTTHRLTFAVRALDKSVKLKFNLQENRSRHVFYLATVHQSFQHDATVLSCLALPAGGSGLPGEVVLPQQEFHSQAPSSASSATTTARTSLSSAGTAEDIASGYHLTDAPGSLENIQGAESEHKDNTNCCVGFEAEKVSEATSLWPVLLGEHKSSNSLSRDNFLSDILWRSGDETDEVFSIENLENEQQVHQHEQREVARVANTVKTSVPRVFHQRSKSNIENTSSSKEGPGGITPELTREFGSDESLLASPKKGHAVRMGTRVSAAALQKRRLRSAEVLQHQLHHHLPSLQELNTTPAAVVVEPSLRSVVVEEESVSDSLLERFLQCSGGGAAGAAAAVCERRLRSITLHKEEGSLGVMIAEGADHGLYIQAVSPGGPAAMEGSLKPGDRIVGINGRSVENLPYTAAVDLLRQISQQVTLLVSQPVTTPSPMPSQSNLTHTATPTQAVPTPPAAAAATITKDTGSLARGAENVCEGAKSTCAGAGNARPHIGEATVRAVGGVVTFVREVRSGPVTVITLNAGSPPPLGEPPHHHPADLTTVPAVGITLGTHLTHTSQLSTPPAAAAVVATTSSAATTSQNVKQN
ncbi:tyrosine-protein phosphatase non-receptor type 13 isoform X4 [Cherax quadricarinatus]|uniref:tyrosine-protein phosphatase non-receptor type 13 isoform X4 n=1 Tax=Cherax quadricarinatus TaxID=27406 RepID=UPI00387E38D5